ncbi:DUF4170 domain-containing protein [Bauldia litoralis]|uniref:DUF4170 domain-containing protein n=1 Tax=Bauldia litoralis TaxID=665467 RepID=UPI003264631D
MQDEFWVVGGRYRDTSFTDLADGGAGAYGPFARYDEAHRSWSDRSNGSRSLASVRYSIVVTASRARAA